VTLEQVLARFPGAKQRGDEWDCRCPAHEDRKASLGIRQGEGGRILFKCQRGCETEAILAKVGIKFSDVMGQNGNPNGSQPPPRSPVVARYAYTDERGRLVATKCRRADKTFFWVRPDDQTGLGGIKPPLFGLPRLLKTNLGDVVLVVEGEKDCLTAWNAGLMATTNADGAAQDGAAPKWQGRYSQWLAEHLPGRRFRVVPDNDEPGWAHARFVAASLKVEGLDAEVLALPGLPPKGDLSDWLGNGHSGTDLQALLNSLNSLNSSGRPNETGGSSSLNSLNSLNSLRGENESGVDAFPGPLADEAFHGMAGEIVRALEPETEADPAALLMNFLVLFGNAVGRSPHARGGATKHCANLFGVLAGRTGDARKGTSYDPIQDLFYRAMPTYVSERIAGSQASGEGLISLVSDRREKKVQVKDKRTGRMTMDFDTVIEDEGVEDKRLMIVETEMSSLLKVSNRSGNILSEQLRKAWETGDLRNSSKAAPQKATDAHISIIGHITPDDLRKYLTETDAANGFGNRFMWLACKKSKSLPEGGSLPPLSSHVILIRELVEIGSKRSLIRRDEGARAVWAGIYDDLVSPGVGMFGEMTARRAPIVLRLSLIYALLDGFGVILVEHLLAALAIWERCEQSVQFLFGDATGDSVADALHEAMRNRPEGATRTDLHAALGRNRTAAEIDRGLAALERGRRAEIRRIKGDGGREVECWFARSAEAAASEGYLAKAREIAADFT
jgi:hypothetical protein